MLHVTYHTGCQRFNSRKARTRARHLRFRDKFGDLSGVGIAGRIGEMAEHFLHEAAPEKRMAEKTENPPHKCAEAPRASRRPFRQARGGKIPRVFDRRATPRDGMPRRPNAAHL